jgi:NNP family nitrate/nitrite transporter-like MFS transporter
VRLKSVKENILPEKANSYRWVVLIIACFGLFTPSYAQYQLPPLAPQIIADLGLSPTQFTSIFSAPMIPAIFLSLVAGLLADKFGIKWTIGIGLILSAIGAFFRIGAGSYQFLFFSMILAGFGATFLNANGAKIIGSWFPPEKIGSMMGIFLAVSTVAMTAGMGTTAMIPGIRTAYILAAALSIAAAVLWVLLMKKPPETGPVQDTPAIPILTCLKVALKSKSVWFVGFCLMGIMGSFVSISSFLPTALGGRGIDPVSAGIYGSAITVGNFLGCLLVPALAGRLGFNKPFLYLNPIIAGLGVAIGWRAPQGALLAICLCITGIAMGGLMPILMSIPIQLPEIGPLYAGTAGGVTGTLQLIGAVVIPTYVVGPIAGTNMDMFFIVGGACMILVFLFSFGLPELGRKKIH